MINCADWNSEETNGFFNFIFNFTIIFVFIVRVLILTLLTCMTGNFKHAEKSIHCNEANITINKESKEMDVWTWELISLLLSNIMSMPRQGLFKQPWSLTWSYMVGLWNLLKCEGNPNQIKYSVNVFTNLQISAIFGYFVRHKTKTTKFIFISLISAAAGESKNR